MSWETAPTVTTGPLVVRVLGNREVPRSVLDLWDAVTNESGVHLTMDLEPGDIQVVRNHSLLHDRTAFTTMPSWPNAAICCVFGCRLQVTGRCPRHSRSATDQSKSVAS